MTKKGLAAADEAKKPKEIKPKRKPKLISALNDGLGWVSFNDYQMEQLGIDPDKNTTSDLKRVVFEKLEIEAKKPKEVPEKGK